MRTTSAALCKYKAYKSPLTSSITSQAKVRFIRYSVTRLLRHTKYSHRRLVRGSWCANALHHWHTPPTNLHLPLPHIGGVITKQPVNDCKTDDAIGYITATCNDSPEECTSRMAARGQHSHELNGHKVYILLTACFNCSSYFCKH